MKRFGLVIIVLVFSSGVWGQSGYLYPLQNLIPKNPEASALSKFVDIPPGNYTGTSSVSVPVYTINANGLGIPISLDYHVSGVKLSQLSTRVGLGWVLNVGNTSLSKQIIGKDDIQKIQAYDAYYFNPAPYSAANSADNYIAQVANGCEGLSIKDTQPDIFTFNLNGTSGKFFIDSNDDFQMIPYSPIKITRTTNFGFILTNTDGIKYTFKSDGMQYTIGESGSQFNGRNSFKLTKIELLNGEEIIFNYNRYVNLQYMISRNVSVTISTESGISCNPEPGRPGALGVNDYVLNTADNTE